MNITELKNLIKEELESVLDEVFVDEELEEAILEAEKLDELTPAAKKLTKKERSDIAKAGKKGDIGAPGKAFADIEAKAKKSGAKDPSAVAGAALQKTMAARKAAGKKIP
jgi:hypothetical protein